MALGNAGVSHAICSGPEQNRKEEACWTGSLADSLSRATHLPCPQHSGPKTQTGIYTISSPALRLLKYTTGFLGLQPRLWEGPSLHEHISPINTLL